MTRFTSIPFYGLTALFISTGRVTANSFGNALSTGPVSSGNFIRQANSTLVLPDTPNPLVNELSLWVGMGMSNGDLVQSLALSYAGTNVDGNCGTLDTNWGGLASVLKDGADGQTEGPCAVASPGDEITMSYLYNDATTAYDQYVYINGNLVSTLSSSSGAAADGWGTAEECQPGTPCGVIDQHTWINTVLVLNEADPDYDSTIGTTGASGSFSTPDGGITWTCDTITIDQYDFTTGD